MTRPATCLSGTPERGAHHDSPARTTRNVTSPTFADPTTASCTLDAERIKNEIRSELCKSGALDFSAGGCDHAVGHLASR